MALCDRLITLSRERSQQDRRAPSTPPLFGSGPTDGLQLAQFLSAELQGVPLPWEGHASLKHNPVKMYSYLENDDLGCGLRRSEVVALRFGDIQKREDHWAIVDLVGKAGHVRTVPVPAWVKDAVDRWTESASIANGRFFRSIRKNGTVWGDGITQNVVWYIVKGCAVRVGIKTLAPHTSEGPAHVCAMPQAANW